LPFAEYSQQPGHDESVSGFSQLDFIVLGSTCIEIAESGSVKRLVLLRLICSS
jgi:hypothetical protein